tara:strand:- start:991 stop:1473 length:483 start_codon:yes stop_codon:yes gene_type:complete
MNQSNLKKARTISTKISNSEQFKHDKQLGTQKEDEIVKFLNEVWDISGDTYKKYENRFSPFDIYNSKYICEIKTRRNSKNEYPTTMVGYNKIKIAEENKTNNYRFIFIFTDGTYYWDFVSGKYQTNISGRQDRGACELKKYCFIDVNDLTLLTTSVKSVS